MPTVHCVVKGRVQGVGFRFFVADEAQALGLGGWVRNLPGGEVEAKASGPEAVLRLFVDRLHEGPILSRVTGVDVKWEEEENDAPFRIR